MDVKSILMVGVGGQGIVLASNILCDACFNAGFDVKKSEIHGMAQRGGSVVSHVRFGGKVYSPSIPLSGADFILSFERMEFLRYLDYVGHNCFLILNSRKILPPAVTCGAEPYPDDIIDEKKCLFPSVIEADIEKTAIAAGNAKTAGTVMLGMLSKHIPIDSKYWRNSIENKVPKKVLNANLKAFELGQNL